MTLLEQTYDKMKTLPNSYIQILWQMVEVMSTAAAASVKSTSSKTVFEKYKNRIDIDEKSVGELREISKL